MIQPYQRPCSDCGENFLCRTGNRTRCDRCRTARNRAKRNTPEGRKKHIAHIAAQKAMSDGHLIRQPCEWLCGPYDFPSRCNAWPTHGHHEDYDKPLDVIWLCHLHHRWRHSSNANAPEWRLLGRDFICVEVAA